MKCSDTSDISTDNYWKTDVPTSVHSPIQAALQSTPPHHRMAVRGGDAKEAYTGDIQHAGPGLVAVVLVGRYLAEATIVVLLSIPLVYHRLVGVVSPHGEAATLVLAPIPPSSSPAPRGLLALLLAGKNRALSIASSVSPAWPLPSCQEVACPFALAFHQRGGDLTGTSW
jgi:hypothetical protein